MARGTVQKGFDEKNITQTADESAESCADEEKDEKDGKASKSKTGKNGKKRQSKDEGAQPKVPRHLRIPRFIAIPIHINFVARVVIARLSEHKNGISSLLVRSIFVRPLDVPRAEEDSMLCKRNQQQLQRNQMMMDGLTNHS